MSIDVSIDVYLVQISIDADKLQTTVDFRPDFEDFLAERLIFAVLEKIELHFGPAVLIVIHIR